MKRLLLGLVMALSCASVSQAGFVVTMNPALNPDGVVNNNGAGAYATTATVNAVDGINFLSNSQVGLSQFNINIAPALFGETNLNAWCIDLFTPQTNTYTAELDVPTVIQSAFTNGAQMAYLMKFSDFVLGPGLAGYQSFAGENDAAAAMQLALWSFSINARTPTGFGVFGAGYGDANFNASGISATVAQLTNDLIVDANTFAGSSNLNGVHWLNSTGSNDPKSPGQNLLVFDESSNNIPNPVPAPPGIILCGCALGCFSVRGLWQKWRNKV